MSHFLFSHIAGFVLGAAAFGPMPTLGPPPLDPGPRVGAASAGQPVAGLTSSQAALFQYGQEVFGEPEDVAKNGLGPRFNSNSCVSCHIHPAAGGSSPKVNPQTGFANAYNVLPAFISANGPIREARFVLKADGTPDGGVHGLFTIRGQADAPGTCQIAQENFGNLANISLRIPTPTFGLGLIEAIPDATLTANLAANAAIKAQFGIAGRFNTNGNDGTITRFGWKAQNKSLQIFAGEAYSVEMGVSNLLFPNKRDDAPGCSPAGQMNDKFNLDYPGYSAYDDVTAFAAFMRFLAPPAPGPTSLLSAHGRDVFNAIGCAYCHTPSLKTGASSFAALSNQTIAPYSDFALHHMGPGLADRISQGVAQGDEFRTAPLWGVGQRLFFLHDGRASDLATAINAHASLATSAYRASEANASVTLYNLLLPFDKQSLMLYLRSL